MTLDQDLQTALARDRDDQLAGLRGSFRLPLHQGSPAVYLCGHSLGLAPIGAERVVNEELERWATLGVSGHFASSRPWLGYHEFLTAGLARLSGALPLEVVAMNSLTVNLHLMLTSFYRPTPQRHRVLIERRAFSSDRYAVASQIQQRGFHPAQSLLEVGPRQDASIITTSDICELVEREGQTIATVLLPGVQYLTGQRFDIATITACAQRQGCTVGWDLAHAIGNTPLNLHDANVDFAVWCSYKYLNAGPGAIGGCFVHERHAHETNVPRYAGWWGQNKATRFDMTERLDVLPGAEGWQISNPSVLAAAPLIASLEIFDSASLEALRAKSLALTGFMESLLQPLCPAALQILTPADPDARGCQLSLRIQRSPKEARAIHAALEAGGFICDWREPDVVRAAPVPLYNTFEEVWRFARALHELLDSGA
jgi:kynureninase